MRKKYVYIITMLVLVCFLFSSCNNVELKEKEDNNSESTFTAAEQDEIPINDAESSNRVVGLVNDGDNGSKVLLYDTDTWKYEIVAELPDVTPDNYAALSSNNKKLAYTIWDSNYTRRYVKVYDIDKQETVDYFKDIPVRTEIIKLSWIPDSDLLLYIRNDTNYNTLQTIEILDTATGQIKVVDTGEVWQIRTTWDMTSTAPPFYQPGSDTYLEVKYKDYSDDTDNEIWNYYLDFDDLADIYEKYGGVREFDFSTILNRMYVEFSAPRCSPNGKYIVYSAKLDRTSAPGLNTPLWVAAAIWLYDIESEETHIIYKQEDEASIGRVDWINDSELCFVTYYDWQGSRDNINYYSMETGKSEVLFHYSEEHYNNVTLLPIGNQKITFTSSANDCFYYESLTYVIDIRTRECSVLNVSYDDKSILLENFIYYIADNSENTASSEREEVNKADTSINSDALHFLLYAGEGDVSDSTTTAEIAEMRTDAFAAEWNISEGSLSVSESPVMTVSGITGQDVIKNWNCSNEYYITDMNMVTSVEGSDKTLIQYIYSEGSTAYYTSDYSLYLSLEDHSITVKSDDACMVFDKTEKEFLLNGEKLSSNNFLMLTPEFDKSENIIYVPFIYPSPAQNENLSDYVAVLSFDMKKK